MDYNTLVASQTTPGSIANWLNHGSLVASAPTIIVEAESMVYRRLRAWQMLTSVTGILSSGNNILTLPSDFIQPEHLMITGINKKILRLKTPQEVRGAYSYDSNGNRIQQQPQIYYWDKTNINFDSYIDSINTYPYDLLYYQQPAPLSVSLTNFLTNTYPRMFRCAIMVGAAEFMKDTGTPVDRGYWLTELQNEIMEAQIEQDRSKHAIEVGAVLVGGSGDYGEY